MKKLISQIFSSFQNFIHQFSVLVKKNFWLHKRNWILTLVHLSVPFFFVVILFFMQFLYSMNNLERETLYIQDQIPRCKGINCKTIIFTPENNEQVNNLMRHICERNKPKLEFGVDVISMKNESMMNDYLLENPNKIQMGIAFDTSRSPLINVFTVYFDSSGKILRNTDHLTPLISVINKAYCNYSSLKIKS
jgi:hypothetical protein